MRRSLSLLIALIVLLVLFIPCAYAQFNNPREVILPAVQNIETGDAINLHVPIHICGGNTIAPQKTEVDAAWGDGGPNERLTFDIPSGLGNGSHVYRKAGSFSLLVGVTTFCILPERNFREDINNICNPANMGITGARCIQHPATINVFDPIPPVSLSANAPITHGKVTSGVLVVTLPRSAPASGTKVTFKSSNPRIKIVGNSVPSGDSSHAFDIDARAISTPIGQVKIDVTSAGVTRSLVIRVL